MRQHENAFDFIRLFAAGLVVWSHQHALMGLSEPSVSALHETYGGVGVLIFFVVSGYLNSLSVLRRRSVASFLVSRGLRIYPGLIVCVGFTVLLGACVAPDIRSYFDSELLSFIGKNTTLFFGSKSGVGGDVFPGNAYPEALNGSLWTLGYEVKMYILLAATYAVCRYRLKTPATLFTCTAVLIFCLTTANGFWLEFGSLFLLGSLIASARMLKRYSLGLAGLGLSSCLLAFAGCDLPALYILLAIAIIVAGNIRLPDWLRLPMDLSYGIYLYAFPVQQLSAMLSKNFWIALSFSTAVTVALAVISSLLIEPPAQRLRRVGADGAMTRQHSTVT